MTDVEGENAYVEDGDSIAENGLCELQIMDCNITYTPELRQQAITGASRLFGLTFLPVEINTTGHPWLLGNELIKIKKTDGTKITTIPFDRTIEYAGHIKTKLVASADTKTETEYKNPGTLETAVKQTRIIVDQQNQTITQVVENVGQYDERITQVEQDVDSISQQVSQITDLTREVTNIGSISTDDDAFPGSIVELRIHGDVVPYYPSIDRYPSTDFYMKPSNYKLYIDYTEEDVEKTDIIPLPFDYLTFLDNTYDEFVIDSDGNASKIKRIGFSSTGQKYILPEEEVIDYGPLFINLHEGVNTLYMNYYTPTIYLKYAVVNDYTDIFATKVELKSSIEQSASNIMLAVNGSLDTLDETLSAKIELKVDTENLISEINASADVIRLTGNRIIIDSDNFKVAEDGTITATNATLNGSFRRYSSDTGYLAVAIDSSRLKIYDWEEENLLAGTLGAVQSLSSGRSGIELYCPNDGRLLLGYENEDGNIDTIFSFDATKPTDPPYIVNTANGTLFPNVGNGITVKNGLITNFSLSGSSGRIFSSNPGGGISVNNGLITGWSITGVTTRFYIDTPSGGVYLDIANGLITGTGIQ